MASLKKNQLNNILVPMVDKDDFASIESSLDAADINVKLYGVAQGVSTAASVITVSKAATLVRSGLFQITLKATETDSHDHYMLRLSSTSTVSCAIQLVPFDMVDNDDSDLMSVLTVIQSMASDAASAAQQGSSRTLVVQSLVSDVDSQLLVTHSLVSDIDSQLLVTHSLLSDVQSELSDTHSDLRSMISGITASISVSDISDIASRVWSEKYATHSLASSFGSLFSVLGTNANAAASRALLNQSRISDVYSLLSDFESNLTSRVPKLVASQSQLSDVHSDLRSQISGITASISVSDISDIASRVWSEKYSTHSLASSFGSLFSLLATDADNTYSLLSDHTSNFSSRVPKLVASQSQLSDVHSDLRSQISGITASISASDISDIASRVWSEKYATHSLASSFGSLFSTMATNADQGNSRALVIQSLVSDVDSQLLVTHSLVSDIDSQLTVTHSLLSDVQSELSDTHSDLRSMISGITASISTSDISDIASRVWSEKYAAHSLASSFGSLFSVVGTNAEAAASRALLNQSRVSDIYSLLSDFESNLTSRVPKLVASQSQLSDVHSDLRSQISGITASVSASDISDIASRVWSEKYATHSLASSFGSLFSVMATESEQGNSRVLVVQSLVSDVDSQLTITHSLLSDVQSELSDTHSDLRSMISDLTAATVTTSDISDIASRVWSEKYRVHSLASSFGSLFSLLATDADQGNSRALVIQSMVSDVDSQLTVTHSLLSDVQSELSDTHSDLRSMISDLTAATVTVSDISNIASRVWSEKYSTHSLASSFGSLFSTLATDADNTYSLLSDHDSNFQSRIPKLVASQSQLSDVHSDLRSQISGITASVSVSDISDIASRVQEVLASDLSDILSAAQQGNSRTLVVQSLVSDVDSQLTVTHSLVSDIQSALSNTHSDLRSQISGITASVSVSDISDIASRVQSVLASDLSDILSAAQQGSSRTLVVQSRVSDVESQLDATQALLSDFESNLTSRVPKAVATQSQVSDMQSDLRSYLVGISGAISDVESQLDVTHSLVSDIDSQLTATDTVLSNVQSVVTAIQTKTDFALPPRIVKNTALNNFTFLMVLSSDNVTGATGLSITATRSIDGAAFASCANAVAEISNGLYRINLAASDLNGDIITLRFTAATADDRIITIIPQPNA